MEGTTDTTRDRSNQAANNDQQPKRSFPKGFVKQVLTYNQEEDQRVKRMVEKGSNQNVGTVIEKLKPIIDAVIKVVDIVGPPIQKVVETGITLYNKLPMDLVYAVLGLILVFFGGSFAVLIAAVEAVYSSGWEIIRTNALYLYNEAQELWAKSREDDKLDEDKDGIEDVKQISVKELFTRKLGLFFANCKDPQKLIDMWYGIMESLLTVIAVLKVEFAKVIALGHSIGENLRKIASIPLVPILTAILPKQYHQWISPVINALCKAVAISIAWFIQRILSAVQSAIRGGLLFSRRMLCHLNDIGYLNLHQDDTYLDEIVGWGLAALGVVFQLYFRFSLPFPLNLLLLPASIAENVIVWIISD